MQLLAPRCKGSRIALIVGTATRSPTLKCIHLYKPLICTCCWAGTEGVVHVDTSRRTFAVALVLTISLNLRDSYTVKVKALANALFVCAPHFSTPPKGHFHRVTGQRYECFLDWAKKWGKNVWRRGIIVWKAGRGQMMARDGLHYLRSRVLDNRLSNTGNIRLRLPYRIMKFQNGSNFFHPPI